ncbi:ankyrin repeat-containing domain protein [Dunaliella salina]|uniref:Ankyrin repeat-containing domain protein n=1 Tax=Dunaliella salina TaxID=3046 RepID=A0ABQ7GW13_DUNSA|nr:ankyrin repeat-containing domain protein [Dunaliella salina]|eukprot:KAF5838806.1 ankyrin repeat-containing domain protein [Dunaliella salina]
MPDEDACLACLQNGLFPLAALAASGATISHKKCLELLLQHGANVNQKKKEDGYTAMHIGTQHNHLGLVKALVEKGAKVNIRGHDSKTCLHLAAQNNSHGILKILLHHGAKVDIPTTSSAGSYWGPGVTPLHFAARENHIQSVRALLEGGADPLKPIKSDVVGTEALWIAKCLGHHECVHMMEDSIKAKNGKMARKEPQEPEAQSNPEHDANGLKTLSVKQLKEMLQRMNLQCPSGLEKVELAEFVLEHTKERKGQTCDKASVAVGATARPSSSSAAPQPSASPASSAAAQPGPSSPAAKTANETYRTRSSSAAACPCPPSSAARTANESSRASSSSAVAQPGPSSTAVRTANGTSTTNSSSAAAQPSPSPSAAKAANGSSRTRSSSAAAQPGPSSAGADKLAHGISRSVPTGGSEGRPDDLQTPSVAAAQFPGPGPAAKACLWCGASGKRLKCCSGCGTVWLCGKECQQLSWPSHKTVCRVIQGKARAELRGDGKQSP